MGKTKVYRVECTYFNGDRPPFVVIFDLADYLANLKLPPGNYQIKVQSRASGFQTSDFSNLVEYNYTPKDIIPEDQGDKSKTYPTLGSISEGSFNSLGA